MYDSDLVGIALFNLVYAHLSEGCQQQLEPNSLDGKATLLFLKRRMAPLSDDYLEKCHETFLALKQPLKESASQFFTRIRQTTKDCLHAGLHYSDHKLMKRALRGGNKHPNYEATYQRYKSDLRRVESNPEAPMPTFTELECEMLNIDEPLQ
jgi:hypothetical protein